MDAVAAGDSDSDSNEDSDEAGRIGGMSDCGGDDDDVGVGDSDGAGDCVCAVAAVSEAIIAAVMRVRPLAGGSSSAC